MKATSFTRLVFTLIRLAAILSTDGDILPNVEFYGLRTANSANSVKTYTTSRAPQRHAVSPRAANRVQVVDDPEHDEQQRKRHDGKVRRERTMGSQPAG